MMIKRGDIFYADLSPVIGSEQGGVRPVVVVQNDIGNKYSPTTIVAAITSQLNKAKLPTHVNVKAMFKSGFGPRDHAGSSGICWLVTWTSNVIFVHTISSKTSHFTNLEAPRVLNTAPSCIVHHISSGLIDI